MCAKYILIFHGYQRPYETRSGGLRGDDTWVSLGHILWSRLAQQGFSLRRSRVSLGLQIIATFADILVPCALDLFVEGRSEAGLEQFGHP